MYSAFRDHRRKERRPLHVSIWENGCFDVTDGDDMYTLVQRVPDEEVVNVPDPLMTGNL